jgi:hypothetical protein
MYIKQLSRLSHKPDISAHSQQSKAQCMHVHILLRKAQNILARTKDKGQRTRDGGTEGGKQRNKGQELWNGATEKGTLGQLTRVRGRRKEDGTQGTDHARKGTETGDRGLET